MANKPHAPLEIVQVGDPVLDSQGNFVLDDAGEVARHTAESIGKNRVEEFLFLRSQTTQSFQLERAPNGFVKVMLGDRVLTASEYSFTGTGGRTLESLVESGMVTGVLDITTTEWADELAGGILSAGPTRLEAAG